MAKELLPDALWARIAPLLPPEPPKPKGGRPRVSDRAALTGILFVLKTGIPWKYLPKQKFIRSRGCGSGMTCWRRLRDWYQAGVWRRLHQVLLEELAQADRIDWDRAALDSAAVPAPGGPRNGQEPNGSRQTGHEAPSCGRRPRHPARGPGKRRERARFEVMLATVDAIEPIRAKTRGRPRRRPHKLHADKGYDYRHLRLALRKRRIIPRIARCGVEPKNRLGRYRWVVERTLSWLNRFRRLEIRYEHRADIHLAFLQLGCALISLRFLG